MKPPTGRTADGGPGQLGLPVSWVSIGLGCTTLGSKISCDHQSYRCISREVVRGGCISAFSAFGNNNLAFIMASDFSRAGPDEMKKYCTSCDTEYPVDSQEVTKLWICTYEELVQGAANGCPRCRFVAACIATIKEYLENEITRVQVYPCSNRFDFETGRDYYHLDVFIEDPKTGESSGYWPTNSTDLFRQP